MQPRIQTLLGSKSPGADSFRLFLTHQRLGTNLSGGLIVDIRQQSLEFLHRRLTYCLGLEAQYICSARAALVLGASIERICEVPLALDLDDFRLPQQTIQNTRS
tara:strand:- start:562 stop:873 length:312 start_codon:yes stop_codon:yes gene_type:complete